MKPPNNFLNVREAAEEAQVYSAYIYWAIKKGVLQIERQGHRIFIPRESFDSWKKHLETRREILKEEKKLRGG